MATYKAPDFNERAALAKAAKQKALDQLKAKPPVDEAELAERKAKQAAREAVAAEKRRARREAEEQRKAAKLTPPPPPEPIPQPVVRSEAELKAARDARYAARKARKK